MVLRFGVSGAFHGVFFFAGGEGEPGSEPVFVLQAFSPK